jgi:hypothetical protein
MVTALFGMTGFAFATTAPWLVNMPGQKKSGFSERMEVPPQGFGAGFQVSSLTGPIGLGFSYLHGPDVEQVGISQFFESKLRLSLDHLHQVYAFTDGDLLAFPVYCGLGIWTLQNQRDEHAFSNQPPLDHWGIRFPIAMSMHHGLSSMDVFAEVSPNLQIRPYPKIGLDGSVGFRIYWPKK